MTDLRLPRVNRVLLAGRVTRDFALRYTVNQVPVAMFTVAFNRPVKNADGTWTDVAGFVNVLTSGGLAERCAERLHKGSAALSRGPTAVAEVRGAGRANALACSRSRPTRCSSWTARRTSPAMSPSRPVRSRATCRSETS